MKTKVALRIGTGATKWRMKAQEKALRNKKVWWYASLAIVTNIFCWVGLQLFVFAFAEYGTQSSFRVTVFMVVFNVYVTTFKGLCKKFTDEADKARIGDKDRWDRYHISNLMIFSFELYRSVFKTSLLTEVGNLSNFISFICVDLAAKGFGTILPMWGEFHKTMKKYKLTKGSVRTNIMDHRGFVCYKAFCQHTADVIATFQFMVISCFLRFMWNKDFFPVYSLQCDAQFLKLMGWVPLSLGISMLNYVAFSYLANKHFGLTPTYVGTCMFEEHETMRRAFIIFAAHVITDVYYALALQSMVDIHKRPGSDKWCIPETARQWLNQTCTVNVTSVHCDMAAMFNGTNTSAL